MGTSPECLRYFADFIEKEIGIVYSEVNYYQLESRLEDIAKQLGFSDPTALWEKTKMTGMNGAMKLLLIDTATNNETSFFRDPMVFRALRTVLDTLIAKKAPNYERLRIWSAACSTGQEVYSLAIMLEEIGAKTPFTYEILATDISERVLKRAADGRYSQLEVQRGLAATQLVKYFKPETPTSANDPAYWTINAELKRNISFQKLNLLEPWPGHKTCDIVLCRNVLIYQTIENKKKVVAKIADILDPGGYLILGGAESLIGISDALDYVTIEGAVVYRKKETSTQKMAV
jgi:chemotaxis protein methyltransferase CheR